MPDKNTDDEWTYRDYKTTDEKGEESIIRIAYAPMNLIKVAQEVMRKRAEKQRRDVASTL